MAGSQKLAAAMKRQHDRYFKIKMAAINTLARALKAPWLERMPRGLFPHAHGLHRFRRINVYL